MKEIKAEIHYISGDDAVVLGAADAGCRFFAGYPITPSTEVAEGFSREMPKISGHYIQMEDEIGSIAAVIGASWGGLKSMTATSGPGFSLMQEHIGYAVITETPCVIVNVQRAGPSTGLPTMPAQGDVMQARWGSHGHYEIIALSPNSPQECYELTARSFNLAEKYRTPVVLLMDECVGHMYEKVIRPEKEKLELYQRKLPVRGKPYLPYKPDSDLIPPMALPGEGFRFHITGLTHDEMGYPAMTADAQDKLVRRLCGKIRKDAEKLAYYEEYLMDDAGVCVVSFGASSRSSIEAVNIARNKGIKAGLLRLITIWPFPEKILKKIAERINVFVVAEMNFGQIKLEVERVTYKRVILAEKLGGEVHSPEDIVKRIMEAVR